MRSTLLVLALLASSLPLLPTASATPWDCGAGISFVEGTPAQNAPVVWLDWDGYTLVAYFRDLGPHCGVALGRIVVDGVTMRQDLTFSGGGRTPDEYRVGYAGSPFDFAPGWHTAKATVYEQCDLSGGCDQATGTWSFYVAPWAARVGGEDSFHGSTLNIVAYYSQIGYFDAGVPTPVCAPPAPCEAAHVSPRLGKLEGEGATVDLAPTPPPWYLYDWTFVSWVLARPSDSPRVEVDASTSVGGVVTVAGVGVPFFVPVEATLP